MLLAIPVALLAGLVSFASPCVLPLVPGYLGYLSGLSAANAGGVGAGRSGNAPGKSAGRARVLLGVSLFILGFTVVFVSLGVLSGSLGSVLTRWEDPITRVLGVVVVLMGFAFIGAVPFLQRERRLHASPTASIWGAPVLGVVFGLGWTPCLGPTLVAINALALGEGSAARGGVLAAAYCLGLGLPFVLIALGLQSSARALGVLRKHRLAVMRAGGALLVLIGLALVSGLWGEWSRALQGLVTSTETVI
ncbi:cytochrome c biogenesis CcdA family protein [Sanguibacter suaedae]|uniref:Cytochrome c biogenesis protein CcdA n=1 Tax=Sanguibacter suaedae TaxID=2795737 RepID=A0A934I835_9MICO|nr:cytochrome c biogenesis protein CcdA [Sanguibacter suaedae]MBI9113945.1 cytochrome c biogenesis protein CcdA [Sanguibacter suaedae]